MLSSNTGAVLPRRLSHSRGRQECRGAACSRHLQARLSDLRPEYPLSHPCSLVLHASLSKVSSREAGNVRNLSPARGEGADTHVSSVCQSVQTLVTNQNHEEGLRDRLAGSEKEPADGQQAAPYFPRAPPKCFSVPPTQLPGLISVPDSPPLPSRGRRR